MSARRAKKREYHHGDLRNALLEAALATLETHGWHELSLRDVARQAGVSHTAPYRHFASKEALLAALAEVGYGELADAMEAAVRDAPGDPSAQLRGTGRAYVSLALRRPALFRLMFSGAICTIPAGGTFSQVAGRSFSLLVRTISDGQAAGVLRPGPPEQAALAAWSLVHGLGVLLLERQLDVLGDGGALDPMALVDAITTALSAGLATGALSPKRPRRAS
jgi:AcrR family transcriptional regulator